MSTYGLQERACQYPPFLLFLMHKMFAVMLELCKKRYFLQWDKARLEKLFKAELFWIVVIVMPF